MSLNDRILKLQKKSEAQQYLADTTEKDERASGKNTKQTREYLLKLSHYYYILTRIGDDTVDMDKFYRARTTVTDKIYNARYYDGMMHEIAEANLMEEHTKAWNIAEYYYEKGTKILCQMMITLMDYIIREKDFKSILYSGKDQSSYFDLLDEIRSLNEGYKSCYYFLCAYDTCISKLADYTGIEEYNFLMKERERLIVNGMPKKVSQTIDLLEETAGEDKSEYFVEIRQAYTPEPIYDKALFDKLYKEAVIKDFKDENYAMNSFSNLVIQVDNYYEQMLVKR